MKKIYMIDTWRRMKKSMITVCCIILIISLGIATYLGILFAERSMRQTGNNVFSDQAFHHFEVSNKYGITQDSIDKLLSLPDIDSAEGLYKTTGFLKLGEQDRLVTVQAFTKQVDTAKVVEGRLPEAPDEIAIEKVMAEDDGIKLDDELEIDSTEEDGESYLLNTRFKVVGVVCHPAYSCNYVYSRRGMSEKGNGNCHNFFLVAESAFNTEKYENGWPSVLLWSDSLDKLDSFSDDYEKKSDQIGESISSVAKAESDERYSDIKGKYQQKIDDAEKQISDAEEEIKSNSSKIEESEKELESLKSDLEELKKVAPNEDYSKYDSEIVKAQEEIDGYKTELESAEKEADEKRGELADYQSDIDGMTNSEWSVLDRFDNVSFAMYKNNAEGLGKLGFSFAFVYIVVALMVCYSSIGRMVTKQKNLIGTQKALGFKYSEILSQYLSYSWVCTFWGCVWGILWAIFFVEKLSLKGYVQIYYFKDYVLAYNIKQIAIVVGAAYFLTTLATIIACNKYIKKNAIELLKERSIDKAKTFFFEKLFIWKKISLFKRTVIKNLLNERRHFISTIIGVSGCTALLIIGFTMKYAISDVNYKQFDEIQKFDLFLQVEEDSDHTVFENNLQSVGNVEYLSISDKMVEVELEKSNNIVADLMCANIDDLKEYFAVNIKQQSENDIYKGAIISSNTADFYKLNIGDKITVKNRNGDKIEVEITGISENYVCHFLIISPETYKSLFADDINKNAYFIKLNGTEKDTLKAALEDNEGFISLSGKESGKSIFKNIADSLNSVIQIMICLSAIMALIVVMNLMIMYINEKTSTLAVMRINGYSLRKTKSFINIGNTVLIIIGLIIGLAVGILLGLKIVMIIENDVVAYEHIPNLRACCISCAISAAYAIIIGAIANIKISKISLTDLSRYE